MSKSGTAVESAVRRAVARIVAEATRDRAAFALLASLTDGIGPRPSGSEAAATAVAWGERSFASRGIRSWRETVVVPRWVRGEAEAHIVAKHPQSIALLALGGSVATPPEGVDAEVVIVRSLEEIDEAGERLRGSIVLMNQPMDMNLVRTNRAFAAYREVNPLRVHGASRAARHGAVAFLIRSLGSASWRLPHAGSQIYQEGVPRIPAASIAAEDADLIERLVDGGPVRIALRLSPKLMPDVSSSNVVGEIRESSRGDELVIIGAHLDSWDVSQGAHDNGAGVVMVIETLRLLSLEDLRPKRTVRGVLFMNEENGGHGGIAYHAAHRDDKVVAVLESDHGAAAPVGFDTTLTNDQSRAFDPMLAELHELGMLAPLGGRARRFEQEAATGVDTARFRADGVPGFGLMPESEHYFDFHHTAADTLDKVDPDHLARCVATFASLTWFLAEFGVPGIELKEMSRS